MQSWLAWGSAWRPPLTLPAEAEVRAERARLAVPPVDAAHAMQCLSWLTIAFESGGKLSADQARLRAATWMEANGDLGNALWTEATTWCLRNHRFGMPTTADFRRAVIDSFSRRQRRLDACARILDAIEARKREEARDPGAAETRRRQRERAALLTASPAEQRAARIRRLRELIPILEKHGYRARAEANAAEVATLERLQQQEGAAP